MPFSYQHTFSVLPYASYFFNSPTVFPKTSMPSVQDYVDVFTPIVKAGEGVLCICITTKFSGSYNSAVNARNMLLEDYPDAKIEVIDSTLNTVEEGIFVREAARMKAAGLSLEESVQALERIKSTGRIIFTVGSLDYLIHGGRIGIPWRTGCRLCGRIHYSGTEKALCETAGNN
jgi:DegV family protein with EDD domain